MRRYILTENEQRILRTYLETGDKLEGFAVLRRRIKDYSPHLLSSLTLITRFWFKDRIWEEEPRFYPDEKILQIVRGISELDPSSLKEMYSPR